MIVESGLNGVFGVRKGTGKSAFSFSSRKVDVFGKKTFIPPGIHILDASRQTWVEA